jgi:hypothetical protein
MCQDEFCGCDDYHSFKSPKSVDEKSDSSKSWVNPQLGRIFSDARSFYKSMEEWANVNIAPSTLILVPRGSGKDGDSFIKKEKTCSNQMCQGEWCDCDNSESTNAPVDFSHLKINVTYPNEQIKNDPEKYESFFAKLSMRTKPKKSEIDLLAEKFLFTLLQVEYIVKEFGMDEAENVLQFCQSYNINPLSLKK